MASNQVLCYNKGCGQTFDVNNNPNDACRYHPGSPVFHDAYKGWSCCNKKTTDFTEFLNIKGCTTGPHIKVKTVMEPPKPVQPKPSTEEIYTYEPPKPLRPMLERPKADSPLVKLPSVIGASLKPLLEKLKESPAKKEGGDDGAPKTIPPGTPCKNATCKETYQGGHSEGLCTYHPGVAIFHEGMKYWSCCSRKTSDFDNFLNQAGCTTGNHLWIKKAGTDGNKQPACRYDWHQTGSNTVVSIYSKLPLPDLSTVEASPVKLKVDLVFGEDHVPFSLDLNLFGVVDPSQSEVNYLSTKVEVKLRKAEPLAWKRLDLPSDKTEKLATQMDDCSL